MKNYKTLFLAFMSLAVCAGVWIIIFHNYPLSEKTDDWSNFGSYLGGVTGPILSFISIILVLKTLQQTQKNHQEQLKFILREQSYTRFNDLFNYFEQVINKSWLNADDEYYLRIIKEIRTSLIFDKRYSHGEKAAKHAATLEIAYRTLKKDKRDIDEIALVIKTLIQYIFSREGIDNEMMKNIIELKISKEQRLIIYTLLRRDYPHEAGLLSEHWPSFCTPL
ncbi:TPA: hypothetical protein LVL65_002237 [Klebsiella oxytoca]|nr:hypothetical protein [Klebsiella oxytoca]